MINQYKSVKHKRLIIVTVMDVIFLNVDTPLFRYNRELNKSTQNIYLFQQWFITNNRDRHQENIHESYPYGNIR